MAIRVDTAESRILATLKNLPDLPIPVSSWLVETGVDATDDLAVWVWAILDQVNINSAIRFRLRQKIREAVREITGSSHWVYVRFRDISEEEE